MRDDDDNSKLPFPAAKRAEKVLQEKIKEDACFAVNSGQFAYLLSGKIDFKHAFDDIPCCTMVARLMTNDGLVFYTLSGNWQRYRTIIEPNWAGPPGK